jgi:paraquat-inducible protein B
MGKAPRPEYIEPMSRKASPVLIGAFVIAGIALLIAGVLVFGGRELFQRKQRFVTYFEGSVQGLRVGADVQFRGVRIGYVTDIQVVADATLTNYQIPVTFEITPDAVTVVSGGEILSDLRDANSRLKDMINAGLRTQLDMESFVTGQLVIDLDMHPETAIVFRGKSPPYPEIPSIPSGIQQFALKVQEILRTVESKVPIEQVVKDITNAINGFDELVNSPDLKDAIAGINRIVNDPKTQSLPETLDSAIAELHQATRETRVLVGHVDRRLEPALARALPVMEQLESTLREGQGVLASARRQLDSSPETAERLAQAITELERSARAIRNLVDAIERQPEALIRGKSGDREK